MTSVTEKETPKHGGELSRGRALAWAFYDWANSAFATTVMAGFFPIFFKQYWSEGVEATESSFWLGATNSVASLVIVLLAPLLGAIADRGSAKKRFLLFFALMGVVMTGSLYFVAQGHWPLAALIYGLAIIGFSGGNIFYDSLIVVVAGEEKLDAVSALGFGLGYLGGGLLFAVNVLMTLYPNWFGLADATQAVQVSFITVAVWWAVFTLPVLLFVPEVQDPARLKGLAAVRAGYRQLKGTFREIRRLRMVGLFLLAYWLYIDGVDTVVRMAVDYGLSLGFDRNNLITALLIVQFVGFPAAIAFGKLGEKLGAKTGIYIGILAYTGITVWGYFMDQTWEFYALAVAIGLVQGGVQSLSRSFYARIIPPGKSGEFFGFYNMLGKFAAVIGPVLMGGVAWATGSTRLSILSLLVLFIIGALLLTRVDEAEGRRMARAL
ncbi:MAG: MFS transporter [Candidatus Competibacteraceae bacterium]|nr:MFS transporter [Candidatus Competibacteraceae bacterium]